MNSLEEQLMIGNSMGDDCFKLITKHIESTLDASFSVGIINHITLLTASLWFFKVGTVIVKYKKTQNTILDHSRKIIKCNKLSRSRNLKAFQSKLTKFYVLHLSWTNFIELPIILRFEVSLSWLSTVLLWNLQRIVLWTKRSCSRFWFYS